MKIIKEFKDFINRGNVVDLAVGVAIGAAFSKIVSSLVDDLLMPPIGRVLSNLDFSNLYLPLSSRVREVIAQAGGTPLALADARKLGPVFAWGNFLTNLFNFLIVAFCVFLVVKAMNAMKRREDTKPSEPVKDPRDVQLLEEIRDLLKAGR